MLNFEYKGISQGKYVEGEIEALNNTQVSADVIDLRTLNPLDMDSILKIKYMNLLSFLQTIKKWDS